jgi:hypothetical protein
MFIPDTDPKYPTNKLFLNKDKLVTLNYSDIVTANQIFRFSFLLSTSHRYN